MPRGAAKISRMFVDEAPNGRRLHGPQRSEGSGLLQPMGLRWQRRDPIRRGRAFRRSGGCVGVVRDVIQSTVPLRVGRTVGGDAEAIDKLGSLRIKCGCYDEVRGCAVRADVSAEVVQTRLRLVARQRSMVRVDPCFQRSPHRLLYPRSIGSVVGVASEFVHEQRCRRENTATGVVVKESVALARKTKRRSDLCASL